ncbi:glycerate kinase [Carnimonas bestiolae]|uniref:glycerate kinase n=1 Tax=Carnimonas bestiolae TaxID=3402172 RepID=UPI003EDC2825
MRVVIAPDSYKDALAASDAAAAIAEGIKRGNPDATTCLCPLGDGGEGTLEAILHASGAEAQQLSVQDALGRATTAKWGLIDRDGARTAIVELAEAAGLQQLSHAERDARITTTYGVGELIRAALDHHIDHLILTLGGSATNDGGTGMLSALGARFLDSEGNPLPAGGAALAHLAEIDLSGLDPRLQRVNVQAAVDVNNPLTGEHGASAVFGPQKGASESTVAELDRALQQLADISKQAVGRDDSRVAGAGAAGGMGFAASAFLNAELRPGIELVTEVLNFETLLPNAQLVIVGEGGLDAQSLGGKTPVGVARLAQKHGIPCVALVGKLGDGWQDAHAEGITAAFALADGPASLEDVLPKTAAALASRAEEITRLWQAAQGVSVSSSSPSAS